MLARCRSSPINLLCHCRTIYLSSCKSYISAARDRGPLSPVWRPRDPHFSHNRSTRLPATARSDSTSSSSNPSRHQPAEESASEAAAQATGTAHPVTSQSPVASPTPPQPDWRGASGRSRKKPATLHFPAAPIPTVPLAAPAAAPLPASQPTAPAPAAAATRPLEQAQQLQGTMSSSRTIDSFFNRSAKKAKLEAKQVRPFVFTLLGWCCTCAGCMIPRMWLCLGGVGSAAQCRHLFAVR